MKLRIAGAALLLTAMLAGCKGQGSANANETGGASEPAESTTDYAGVYLDEDRTDNTLTIVPDSTGGYDISIGIFRLCLLDDGHGQSTDGGLAFTATDPSGEPISGVITLSGDTATVTFTDSQWEYLPNGEQVLYFRPEEP